MTREEAYALLTKYLTNKNLIKHCLACEVTMRALAKKFNGDENEWGITGLLHDIDYEVCQKENLLNKHGILLFDPDLIGVERSVISLPEKIQYAIQAHNYHDTNVLPQSKMDWAIVCADRLTGLIVAATLVLPDRKIATLTTESVLKRFKEKSFAKGANRESILLCEEKLEIPLNEFVGITLKAMQSISDSLGL